MTQISKGRSSLTPLMFHKGRSQSKNIDETKLHRVLEILCWILATGGILFYYLRVAFLQRNTRSCQVSKKINSFSKGKTQPELRPCCTTPKSEVGSLCKSFGGKKCVKLFPEYSKEIRFLRCKFCWPENILYLLIEGPHTHPVKITQKNNNKKWCFPFFGGECQQIWNSKG